jgi:outer membrane lipoprotein-sorting protein
VVGLAVWLPGCRMNEAVYHQDGSRIDYARPALPEVMAELNKRQAKMETVLARLNIILHDYSKNKDTETPLAGVYLGDNEGNLRLRVTASGGQLVLDMGNHGDVLEIYLPRQDRYFRGKRQDMLNNSTCQLALLAHAGRAKDLFFPNASSDHSIGTRVTYRNGREVLSVLERPSYIRRCSRRLTIAPEAVCVEMMEVYDKFGREVGYIRYSDYRFPDADNETPAEGSCPLIYPGCIALHSPDGLRTLELRVEEIQLNTPIPKEKFDVPVPEEQKVMDLGQALKKRNGKLWD